MSFSTAVDEANLALFKWPISVASVSNLQHIKDAPMLASAFIPIGSGAAAACRKPYYLRLSRQFAKQFIIFKFGLLVGDHTRHLKDEPRQLLEDGGRFKGQHFVVVGRQIER